MPNWTTLGFILKSKNRRLVLGQLSQKTQNPSSIAKALNNHRSTISKIIGELHKKGLVESLTPQDPTFRIYKITKKGTEILKEVKKIKD